MIIDSSHNPQSANNSVSSTSVTQNDVYDDIPLFNQQQLAKQISSELIDDQIGINVLNKINESAQLIKELGNYHGTIEIKYVGNDNPHVNINEIKLPS